MPPSNTLDFNFSIADPLKQRQQSRWVAGLLLTVVLVLHTGLAWYLLNAPKTEPTKQPIVIEFTLSPLAKPAATELPPAAPPVAKKEPEKPKPVVKKQQEPVKKPVVIKKAEPKPQPTEITEVVPAPASVEPAPPVITPTPAAAMPSNSQATAKPTQRRDADNKTVVSGVAPLVIVKPIYPNRAASRGTEGWVKVEFTIQTDGTVADAVVVQSEPEGTFDDAALTAINQWEFKAKIVNGTAVPQRAVQLLQFKLDR